MFCHILYICVVFQQYESTGVSEAPPFVKMSHHTSYIYMVSHCVCQYMLLYVSPVCVNICRFRFSFWVNNFSHTFTFVWFLTSMCPNVFLQILFQSKCLIIIKQSVVSHRIMSGLCQLVFPKVMFCSKCCITLGAFVSFLTSVCQQMLS